MAKRLTHLQQKQTLFLLCDVQEKFRAAMPLLNNLIENAKRLTIASKILNIALLVTEQNPGKLGKTVKELDISHAKSVVAKTRFSMLVPEIECEIKNLFNDGKPCNAVLYGVESHVCVLQTAVDLLTQDINVYLPADCVCSRVNQDRNMALERLRFAGCIVTTGESIIYELLSDKNNSKFDEFKKILLAKSQDMQINQGNITPKL